MRFSRLRQEIDMAAGRRTFLNPHLEIPSSLHKYKNRDSPNQHKIYAFGTVTIFHIFQSSLCFRPFVNNSEIYLT